MNSGVPFFTGSPQTQPALEIAQVIFDHLPEGLWIYQADGTCLSVNPVGQRISDQAEIFKQNFRQAVSWQSSGLLEAAEQALATGRQQHCEVNLTAFAARPLWLDCTLTPCPAAGQTFLLLSAEDLTARHRKLAPSTQAIFDAATEAIYLLDTQGVIQAINQTNAARLGRPVDELIGRNLYDLLSPSIAEQRRTYNQEVIATAKPLIYEDQHDGLWLENSVFPVLDAQGQVVQLAVFSRDISARKFSETVLKKQEENYHNLFENMLDGCAIHEIVLDDTGKPVDYRYLAANPAFERMTGLKAEKLIGHTVKEALPGIEDFWIEKFGRVALTGEPVHFEDYTRELDRTYEVTAYRPAPNQFAVITVDVSMRKRMEAALKTSEQRLNLALETARMGVWEFELSTRKSWRSPRHDQIFGYTGLEPDFGQDIFLEHFLPEDRAAMTEQYNLALTTGELRLDARILRKDSMVRWVSLHGQVIRGEQGQPLRLLGTIVDITESKQAENLLLERTRELMRSNAELEQFANIASHDLQEPLRMVASFTQLLERRYQGQLDKNADEYIHFITEGAVRMQHLIQDLLSISRVGTHTKPFTRVALEPLVQDVLDNLQVAIQENGAEITHNALPVIFGDPIQLAQVFQNLIANALKFHSSQPPRIHISASRQGKDWVISVRDNGIGIAPQYFDRIFIIFQRLHNRDQYSGTGIGLAICKKIIERHGGHIWVDSIAGQGATFSFTIPILHDVM
jgi:PAS domain S-box-containing protein